MSPIWNMRRQSWVLHRKFWRARHVIYRFTLGRDSCNDYAICIESGVEGIRRESLLSRKHSQLLVRNQRPRFTTHYLGYVGKSRLSLNRKVDRVHPRRSFGVPREVKRVCSNTSMRGHDESMRKEYCRKQLTMGLMIIRLKRSVDWLYTRCPSFFSQSFATVDSTSENRN